MNVTFNQLGPTLMDKVSLLNTFEQLSDPRIERTKKYPLNEILLLIISAALSGCTGWKSIKDFGDEKLDWLRKFLPYDNGIPVDDTIARLVRRLCPVTFKRCFYEWTQGITQHVNKDIIPIDGKTVRGSHDKDRSQSPIHLVSAWSDSNSVVLGQEKVAEKSNEITAIPKLLELLDIEQCIVTIDSMGCQKAIAEAVIKKKGDYILGLKGNQGTLFEDVKTFFDIAVAGDFDKVNYDYSIDVDKGHGRIEQRECWAIRAKDYKNCFRTLKEWKQLESIIMMKSTRLVKSKTTVEYRYYISSCSTDALYLSQAIRKHWGIESMHWILDITFREDESRIRKGDGPENIAVLRHIALNTMKKYSGIKDSIKSKIRRAMLSDTVRENIMEKVMNILPN